jgi:hypothetical protein
MSWALRRQQRAVRDDLPVLKREPHLSLLRHRHQQAQCCLLIGDVLRLVQQKVHEAREVPSEGGRMIHVEAMRPASAWERKGADAA